MVSRHVKALKSEGLKTGFTTGACSSAASKVALQSFLLNKPVQSVSIPFPQGLRYTFTPYRVVIKDYEVSASIIKEAGDDPDVTNGAEIVSTIRFLQGSGEIIIKGGYGVGIVTKPGLAVSVGQPAINPVPQMMIIDAIKECLKENNVKINKSIEVTISVTNGRDLAKKTLNQRLGIIGGLSILGTTGIVKPLSTEAWTSTIKSSMDVAKALNREEIVLSTGRTSEMAHMLKYSLPEECYVMMGDYLDYAMMEAIGHSFKAIHVCAQWAKMLKIATGNTNTHVRFGVIQLQDAINLINKLWLLRDLSSANMPIKSDYPLNTARELFGLLQTLPNEQRKEVIRLFLEYVASKLKAQYHHPNILIHLVSYDGQVISFN